MISLEELLGIEYPIIQGGMAHVAKSTTGGSSEWSWRLRSTRWRCYDTEELRDQIREVRRNTSKPFGVNLMLQSEFWQDQIKVVLEEKLLWLLREQGILPVSWKPQRKRHQNIAFGWFCNQALLLEKAGADGVIAEGKESGGHIGDVTTIVLVNAVLKSLRTFLS